MTIEVHHILSDLYQTEKLIELASAVNSGGGGGSGSGGTTGGTTETGLKLIDHMVFGAGFMGAGAWSGATISRVTDEENRFGVVSLNCGTGSGGFSWHIGDKLRIRAGDVVTFTFKTPAVIEPTYTVRAGFADSSSFANSCGFAIAGTTMTAIYRLSSAETASTSSYTVTPSTWYRGVVEAGENTTTVKLYSLDNTLLTTLTVNSTLISTTRAPCIAATNSATGTVRTIVLLDTVELNLVARPVELP